VRTTGVFCIATCRARKPKRENVEFFEQLPQVLASGYRPCKVCRPTEAPSELIEDARLALERVRAEPKARLTDADLRALGVRPSRLRTWFEKHYGMTFQAKGTSEQVYAGATESLREAPVRIGRARFGCSK
jgi:AraC family transcriptional regulator of adaptative response/methylated-DNA-[protein]-cysteine methyltransferase